MGLLDFLRWSQPEPQQRAYTLGAGVDQAQVYHGIDNSTFQPPEYVEYLAASNAVYACVTVRATNLSGLPLKIYRVKANGDREEVTAGPLVALLKKVNPYWTLQRLVEMTEQSMGIHGEAFWFMAKQGRMPAEIWWARADRVKVHPHPTEYISHFTYEPPGAAQPIKFERDETIWFRYPNMIDEYSGLSPLAAARLAADTTSAAMHSNFNIFRNGVQAAGMLVPKSGTNFTTEQAKEVADHLDRRARGVDKAHRMLVLRFDADVKSLSMTPKDAEFLGALNYNLEDIARAYRVPIDKIGGKRTYQNVEESESVFWNDCMIPEARFFANELTEQLLPHFGKDLIAEFDLSGIAVLQEDEGERWTIAQGQISAGAMTVNEYREARNWEPVKWGDVWWAQSTLIPIDSPEKPEPIMPAIAPGDEAEEEEEPTEEPERSRHMRAMVAYGSERHQQLWRAHIGKTEPWEQRIGKACADLMQRQKASILSDLAARSKRELNPDDPFDRARWIKAFRTTMRPIIAGVTYEAATLAANELGVAFAFDVQDPNIIRAIERQTQRFAVEVNNTTWDTLRAELSEGINAGDGSDQLAERVDRVMGDRIRSSKETIARTEANTASNQGTLESWRQSGVVEQKEWLAALDDRTRETHIDAHGQRVGIDEDFQVGACSGPSPGQTGCGEEDINCRCTLLPVLDVEVQP